MTIRARILIPMIILTIIASTAVLVSNISQFSSYDNSDINSLLSAASESAFNQIEIYKTYSKTVSLLISVDNGIIKALANGNREELLQQAVQLCDEMGITFCAITDTSGIVLTRTYDPMIFGDDITAMPSVKSALAGDFITTVESGPIVRMSVCSGAPILDAQGNLLGAVATGFRLDTNDFVDSIASIFGCETTVLLGDERIATTMLQDDGQRAVGLKAPDAVAKTVLTGDIYTGRIPLMERDSITRYTPIRDIDGNILGMLFVGYYLEKETDTIRSFIQFGLLFTGLLLAAFIPIIIYTSRRIAAPISEASGVLSEIAKGNFNARVIGNHKGDLGLLQNSVNDTALQLSIYLKEKLQEDKIRNLAAIVAIADAGIIVKDKNGIVVEWNIGAENILGYKPEEMIGCTTHHYAPKEGRAEIDEIERRISCGEHIVHVEVVRQHKDGRLIDCSASYTPIFDEDNNFTGSVSIFHDISDKKQIELALKDALLETEKKHQTIMSSMEYARKIQTSILPKDYLLKKVFLDYSIIWKPRDTVGGDIYWLKNFSEGTVLCACDCTGHGTPGALLTMLVVSAFEAAINEGNYKDTAQIIWELEQRLVSVFDVNSDIHTKRKLSEINDGCDLAVLYISNGGSVTISSGNLHVFVCDGKRVTRIKGQKIFVGEGGLDGKDNVQIIEIPANPDNKYYIASDGLYDQIGGEHERPFGYETFMWIILKNHHKTQAAILDMIWQAFESYRGGQARRDDVGIITFIPRGLLNG